MYYYDMPYFGMHFLWWMFWIILWIALLTIWTPVPRQKWRTLKETPLNILQRRLANGEINENDYERRKALIDRDTPTSDPRKTVPTKHVQTSVTQPSS